MYDSGPLAGSKIQDLASPKSSGSRRRKPYVTCVSEPLQRIVLLSVEVWCNRIFVVPFGCCGLWENGTDTRYRKVRDRMEHWRLGVTGELSLIGRQMLPTIDFKLRDTLVERVRARGDEISFGGKDVVLSGDPKPAAPLGDEAMWRDGEYRGKGQNKPKGSDGNPPGAKRYKKNSCAWARRLETLFKTESFSGKCMV